MPVKKRKRRRIGTSANGCHRRRAEGPNDVWCWDFVYDRTVSGSQLKWLSVGSWLEWGNCVRVPIAKGAEPGGAKAAPAAAHA